VINAWTKVFAASDVNDRISGRSCCLSELIVAYSKNDRVRQRELIATTASDLQHCWRLERLSARQCSPTSTSLSRHSQVSVPWSGTLQFITCGQLRALN